MKNKQRRRLTTYVLSSLAAAALALTAPARAQTPPNAAPPIRDTRSDTWTATDALNRTLPDAAQTGPPRARKTVGIFYFLWMETASRDAPLDLTKIVAANPLDPAYGPVHAFHWWGEPRLGYYLSNDAFVIRKHVQMLADAQVDVLILDVTNALTYRENYLALCGVLADVRKTGRVTPQIAFITHAGTAQTVDTLYRDFYGKNLHPESWFRWKGKPLLLAKPEEVPANLRDFFTLRESWAWSDAGGWFGDGKDKWPWIDNTPQRAGWHDSPSRPEAISVATAQHATTNLGRSYQNGKEPAPSERKPERGLYFAEQAARALAVDPEFVFVTGWNEWIAQRFISGPGGGPNFLGRTLKPGETFFVDQYSAEFSRDMEPMRGGFGDNYYYQLADFVRRYKGVRARPKASAPRAIRIAGDFNPWRAVGPTFLDDIGDTVHRNHPGWGTAGPYVNTSGRNDLDAMKVARDARNVYFYVRTREPMKADADGPILLLNTDNKRETGWESYDFAVRRMVWKNKPQFVLCRRGASGAWTPIAPVASRAAGREMHLAVPRAALGLSATPNNKPLRFDFKWTDNVANTKDILDFLDQGDVAPNNRFNYRFEE